MAINQRIKAAIAQKQAQAPKAPVQKIMQQVKAAAASKAPAKSILQQVKAQVQARQAQPAQRPSQNRSVRTAIDEFKRSGQPVIRRSQRPSAPVPGSNIPGTNDVVTPNEAMNYLPDTGAGSSGGGGDGGEVVPIDAQVIESKPATAGTNNVVGILIVVVILGGLVMWGKPSNK